MRVRRPGTGFKAVRTVFMAMRVNMRRRACMSMGMHRAIVVSMLMGARLAFEPDFA
jgi:hypothetical protein